MDDTRFAVPQIANRARLPEDEVRRVFDVLSAFLEEGHPVVVYGFGTFTTDFDRGGKRVIKFSMSPSLRLTWARKRNAT